MTVQNITIQWFCGFSAQVTAIYLIVPILISGFPESFQPNRNPALSRPLQFDPPRVFPPSPCHSVFKYEGREPSDDSWIGDIYVSTDEVLVGMRLDITLDRPARLLSVSKLCIFIISVIYPENLKDPYDPIDSYSLPILVDQQNLKLHEKVSIELIILTPLF